MDPEILVLGSQLFLVLRTQTLLKYNLKSDLEE